MDKEKDKTSNAQKKIPSSNLSNPADKEKESSIFKVKQADKSSLVCNEENNQIKHETPQNKVNSNESKPQGHSKNQSSANQGNNSNLNSNSEANQGNNNNLSSNYLNQIENYKLKEKTLQEKVNQLEQEIEKERENNKNFKIMHQKIVDDKNKELKEKEKSFFSITSTNTKLMHTLEELRKEVDEQFDKVSLKGLNKIIKKKEETKQNPLDIVIKVKEKELKNANHFIEILRKDNEQLNKNLENYSDFKNVIELKDKLIVKERENSNLLQEIKLLNKSLEEHKKCITVRQSMENDIKIIKDEYKILKDNLKTHQIKKTEENKSHQKLVEQYFNLKKDFEKIKNSANVKDIRDTQGIDRLLNQVEKKKMNNFNHDSAVAEVLHSEENFNENRSNNRKIFDKNSKSVTNNLRSKKRSSSEEEKSKLFSSIERLKLEKIMTNEEVEKLEKKFETLEHSKNSIQNKHKSDLKLWSKKLADMEEKLEFMNIQLKEIDQKYKINQFQINEYKNEQKAYQRKLVEMQTHVDTHNSQIKEKEQENKILINQLNTLRKIVKHNALPPMDNDLAKHLEKIKNEESNMNSFNNELNDLLKGSNDSAKKTEEEEEKLSAFNNQQADMNLDVE
jgi:hypothetical protein